MFLTVMLIAPVIIGALIAAAAGLASAGIGAHQANKAAQIANSNKRPPYNIPQSEYDNLTLLQDRAQQGLTDSTKQAYLTGSNRALSQSISAILKGGGDVNNISDAYSNFNDGLQRLQIADDNMRLANINALIAQNQRMSDFADKKYQVNEYAPYANKALAAATLQQQGAANISNGINSIGGAAISAMGAVRQQNDLNTIGGGGNSPASPVATGVNNRMGAPTTTPTVVAGGGQINNSGVGLLNSPMYDPKTGSYYEGLDITKVRPQNRTAMLKLLN